MHTTTMSTLFSFLLLFVSHIDAYLQIGNYPNFTRMAVFPTHAYFQGNQPTFNRTNCLYFSISNIDPSKGVGMPKGTSSDITNCSFPKIPSPVRRFVVNETQPFLLNYSCTIGVLLWAEAVSVGCRCINEALYAVQRDIPPQLTPLGLSNTKLTVAMVLPPVGAVSNVPDTPSPPPSPVNETSPRNGTNVTSPSPSAAPPPASGPPSALPPGVPPRPPPPPPPPPPVFQVMNVAAALASPSAVSVQAAATVQDPLIVNSDDITDNATISGPVSTKYISHSYDVRDDIIPLDVVFLGMEDFFVTRSFTIYDEVIGAVYNQPGPWNAFFQSTGYRAYVWVMFGLNAAMFLVGLIRFIMAAVQRTLAWDKRTIAFILGLISAGVFGAQILQRRLGMLYTFFDSVSSFFFAIAFFILLLLWDQVLTRVQLSAVGGGGGQRTMADRVNSLKRITPLQIVVYFAMIVTMVNFTAAIVYVHMWPNSVFTKLMDILGYILPSSQGVVAIFFLAYAIRFFIRRNSYKASRQTRKALDKLSILAVFGFLTFVAKAVTNFLADDERINARVRPMAALFIITDIAATLRAFAILLVLGVRLPRSDRSIVENAGRTLAAAGLKASKRASWLTKTSVGRFLAADSKSMVSTTQLPRSEMRNSLAVPGMGNNASDVSLSSRGGGSSRYNRYSGGYTESAVSMNDRTLGSAVTPEQNVALLPGSGAAQRSGR